MLRFKSLPKRSLPLFAAVALASCAALQPPVERVEFPIEIYEELPTEGDAVVEGQAFMKTRGGDVKTAAGEQILLNPVTPYSEQWFEVSYQGGRRLTDPDPRQDQFIRMTIADADGRFRFEQVAPGDYFLTALVRWEVAMGSYMRQQGGYICERITVTSGDELSFILTR
jgi:hypothetical protein